MYSRTMPDEPAAAARARERAAIPVLFLIRSLDYGGAQRQLIALARSLDKQRFRVTVATFYDGGELRAELASDPAVRVVSLGKRGRWDVLPFAAQLFRLAWQERPAIVHGYMSVANELCLLLGRLLGARVVWGLRVSDLDMRNYNWLAGAMFRIGAWLSRWPDLIIANSHAGLRYHASHGYASRAMVVVPNGIDIARFTPDRVAGAAQRECWGIPPGAILIGQVSRLDPMKGHATFLEAAARLARERPQVHFVCVGAGQESYAQELRRTASALGLDDRLTWAGATDAPLVAYNALDIATLASRYGEGFANTIGEAMACGVPCVATDAGDSAWVVGDAAQVVPPGDADALAQAWLRLADMPAAEREQVGQCGRARITEHFSVEQLAAATQTRLEELLA